jgi:hypothetical protein
VYGFSGFFRGFPQVSAWQVQDLSQLQAKGLLRRGKGSLLKEKRKKEKIWELEAPPSIKKNLAARLF